MTVNKLTSPISQNDLINKTNEIIDNLGGGGANTDLSNLTATGEAHFQEPLVSGTNIKTVNNESLLGSGNIEISGGGSYSGGTGISITSANVINHSNSISAGTIGSSSSTSGSTIAIPYATYDAQGHITAKGTHTHTVTGFLTSSSSYVASTRFDGQWVQKTLTISTATSIASRIHGLSSYLPSDSYSYEVLIVLQGNSSSSSVARLTVGTAPGPAGSDCFKAAIVCNTNSRLDTSAVILPVGTDRHIYSEISGAAFSSSVYITAYGYRRIGTNS